MFDKLHAKSIEMDLEYYENADYYDKLHRAQQEAPYRPTRIVNGFFSLAQSSIALLAIAGFLLSFHWSIPFFLMIAAIPGLLIRLRFANTAHRWSRRRTPVERKAGYYSSILTEGYHAKEIRLFNLGDVFVERFRNLRTLIRQERLNLAAKRSISELATHAGAIVPAFAVYGFLAYRALNALLTIGDLAMFYQAIQRGQTYLQQLLSSIAELYENSLFLSNLHEFLSLTPRITVPARAVSLKPRLRDGIVFHGVKFQYPIRSGPS